MIKKIIVTGATGLIGSSIVKKLIARGDDVTIFTRDASHADNPSAKYIEWTPGREGEWEKAVEGKDGIIHLAGASIFGKRWNEEYKRKIMESRESGTRSIVNAIAKANRKPPVLISASGIGYYGKDTGERVISEADPPGDDFLAKVCNVWEAEAAKAETNNVRWISIRTGVVLDRNEGALKKMLLPFRLLFGGPLGSGKQWFSWIHIDELSDIYIRVLDDNSFQGAINGTSPNPVKMGTFADTLGEVMKRPSWFRVPEFLMKIVIGEAAEFITGGQKVMPDKLLEMKYNFKYPDVKSALQDLLK